MNTLQQKYKELIKRLQSKYLYTGFYDKINGKAVNVYKRKDGSMFIANSKLGSIFFYVEKS